MVKALRRTNWTFQEFILAWVGVDGNQDIRLRHKRYFKQKQRRRVLQEAMRTVVSYGICKEMRDVEMCEKELNKLIKKGPFSRFSYSIDIESLDYTEAIKTMKEVAPTWSALLQTVMRNRRIEHQSSYPSTNMDPVETRMFTVTSIVCFSRAKQTSNILPSCLDLYLLGSGVSRRVIETLAGLGLCHTYHYANGLMDRLSKHAAVG